ncbi:uncharacterized protein LOC129227959 [Uloborus diversus]|uniref:uncharacterized protein LOC129227959 n=1 Tax=Uloborus diversus TaxID=327109 RepID=UPI00240998EA|nr:uncharacterized protein LOC129227959 [Uloborus diversus]
MWRRSTSPLQIRSSVAGERGKGGPELTTRPLNRMMSCSPKDPPQTLNMLPEAPVQPGAPVHLPRTSSQSSPLVMAPATPTTSQNALHQSPAMQISSSEQNLFQKLLRSFHLLRMEVKEIKATLDLLVEQSNNSRNQSSVAVTNIDVKLPLEDFEGVQNLERLLEEERQQKLLGLVYC